MRVLVLGAGVVGLASAYALATDGHDVTVLERNPGVGQGASFANGAQLSYSYVAPLASPEVTKNLPGWMWVAESPIRFRPGLSPRMWGWAARFLLACSRSKFRTTVRQLLALTSLSQELLRTLLRHETLDFDLTRSGKLVVYSDPAALRDAATLLDFQRSLGCDQQLLDTAACLTLEPALTHMRQRLQGGIFAPGDETGDCARFCGGLAQILTVRYGVRILLDTPLLALRSQNRRVVAANTRHGELEADAYVMALGTAARHFAGSLGFDLPIVGLKGYSLTVPITAASVPRLSVTDMRDKIVYAPLGRFLRIAGIADLERDETNVRPERLALLERRARSTFPEGLDYGRAVTWVGARPVTPSGVPILGLSPTNENLYLNVGHGALGFTLAMASGRLVADRLAGRSPAASLQGLLS